MFFDLYIYFLKPLLQLEGGQYFKKDLIYLLVKNRILQFFQTLIRMKAVFRYSKIVFFNECFIMNSGNGL